jgi:hypothetical protein
MALLQFNKAQWRKGLELPGGTSLKNHRKVAEFLHVGFKQHPATTSVFTAHLDRYRVSKTLFATLETSVRTVKTDMAAIQTSVNRLDGARGNTTPRASAPAAGLPPP